MSLDTLKLDLQDGVARVTLNRPDAANAIDLPNASAGVSPGSSSYRAAQPGLALAFAHCASADS